MSYYDDIKVAACLNVPWNDLHGKNILITGSSGMISSTLVDVLMTHREDDCHIYASGRNLAKMKKLFAKYVNDPLFHILEYDVREPLESKTDFQIIIAGAGIASPQLYYTDPVGVMKSNFVGVDNLFSYGIAHNLEKFLYISSGEIYGEGDGRVFEEDYSGYVNCATLRACYPSAKRATETLCIAYGHQYAVDVRIARPCHIYGPHFSESDNRVYAQFIRNIHANEDIVIKSTGTQFRSWCYVVDCAIALLYILLMGENGQAYNIADNSSNITIREFAEMVANIGGKKVIMDMPSETEMAGYNVVTKSVFTTGKLHKLGWSIKGSMRNKMKTTIEEYGRFINRRN